jgi:hypothetical protein
MSHEFTTGLNSYGDTHRANCAKVTILENGFETRMSFCRGALFKVLKQQQEKPVSKHDSVTKRKRRPKSDRRVDYTARTMAVVKQLSQAAKVSESQRVLPKSG